MTPKPTLGRQRASAYAPSCSKRNPARMPFEKCGASSRDTASHPVVSLRVVRVPGLCEGADEFPLFEIAELRLCTGVCSTSFLDDDEDRCVRWADAAPS